MPQSEKNLSEHEAWAALRTIWLNAQHDPVESSALSLKYLITSRLLWVLLWTIPRLLFDLFFTRILTLVSRVRVVLRLINYGNADKAHLDFRERGREENKNGRQRTVVRESAWFLLLRWAMCVCVASSSNPRKQEYRKREGKRKRGKGGWVIMC